MVAIGGSYIQNLSVTNDGVHFSDAVAFEHHSELVIHDFKPKFGWMSGGVAVCVSFDSFLVNLNESLPWYCKFNHSLSTATLMFYADEHGLFSCPSPPFMETGYVTLEMTQNQVDYFSNGEKILYLGLDQVTLTLIPHHGPASGGTQILIQGWT